MLLRITLYLSLFSCLTLQGDAADFPLRDVAVREAKLLSSWRFQAVPQGQEDDVDWSGPDFRETREAWKKISIPAVWDRSPGNVRSPAPRQVGWFRKVIRLPDAWDGDVSLCFLGVKYVADVFVNGEYITLNRGGYTPFFVSLGLAEELPETLEVLVRVDNRLDDQTIPKANTGWEIYGGITREVYLLHRPPTRPEDPFAQTSRDDEGNWRLRLSAETLGTPDMPMRVRLAFEDRIVAEGTVADWSEGLNLTLDLQDPALWSPDAPNLHQLELRWADEYLRFPVGVREIAWENGRLKLNGAFIWLQGFGQHEFYPESGPILSTEQRRRDLRWMKEDYGANALRTGHYPNHPDIFNLADELGLFTFTEIPAWQNHPRILAQDDVWETWLEPQLTSMVLRHRNTAGLFSWAVLNETGGAHTYVRRARAHIQLLDPSRPVSAVIAKDNDLRINQITDLAARNLHYGWYHSRSVYDLRESLEINLNASQGNPLWVAELGGQARPGRLGGGYSDDVRGTETYQDKMTRFGLQYILANADRLVGISLWTWSDYRRGGRAHDHGILGPERSPKIAAYTALNLMRPDFRALALENETVIPAGEDFTAELAVFAMNPVPGKSVRLSWEIRYGRERVKQGSQTLTLGEGHVTRAETMRWTVPENIDPGLHHLYLELHDENGARLHSQALPFEPGETTRPGVVRLKAPADGRARLLEVAGMTLTVYPHTGLILPLPPGDYEARADTWVQEFTIAPARFTDLSWD